MESTTTLIGGTSGSGGQSVSIPVSVSASDNNNTHLQQAVPVRVRSRRPFWNGLRTSSDRSSNGKSGSGSGSDNSLLPNEETQKTKTGGRSWRSLIKRESAVSASSRSSRSSSASVKSMGNTPLSCMDAAEEESKSNALVSLAVTNADEPPSSSRSNGTGPIQFVLSVASKIGEAIERLLLVDETPSEPVIRERAIPGGVMLEGCQTKDEHFQRHDSVIDAIQELKGEHGLKAVGFEMRFVPCDEHAATATLQSEMLHKQNQQHHRKSWEETTTGNDDTPEHDESSVSDVESPLAGSNPFRNSLVSATSCCERCVTRLFYNGTPVDERNRRRFVSDGKMYDEISRLCMEHAQDVMISEGDLEWKSIDMDIQVLVSKTMDWSRPTLLFVTGRGKVRAGIFSRKHILTTGMEPSTAIATVREAKSRNMNIIMLDPNCRGEREAYKVVERSMCHVFSHLKQNCNDNNSNSSEFNQGAIFFQIHSASGAHVVCSLMDNCDSYLPHVRAIAFTDSTHNIQWTRKDQHRALYTLLESSSSVYFRSSKGDAAHPAGLEVSMGDADWVRRFGKIRTVWAGTTEHSLSDWCARDHIWSHFDMHLT